MMNMHIKISLTSLPRKNIWQQETGYWWRLRESSEYHTQLFTRRETRARKQEFMPRKSTNGRFLAAKFGITRLAKIETSIERKNKAEARRYNKNHLG
ncbi:MAG: hypothetical protein QS748_14600 [Candidatus Endonucleobacter bathymodioli]|uniref:Uncharacterized protein n=1 Tax=Candidatus Endonucleibacter bathymodioli TaxID=539814 RepID=A0AA90NZ64_9GAMM|nr:hypothetical protein [Candidatus Endonucleobacter bathymodioli]